MFEDLPALLGDNLVGVYLYGSRADGSFVPDRSDIDAIVVTRRELSDAEFGRLERALGDDRLQLTFLVDGQQLTMDAPACLYQFGKLQRCRSDGNPIIWMQAKPLFGALPALDITPEILHEALTRELGYLRDEFANDSSEWRDKRMYRAYAVLTVCRILWSREHGDITSKATAARWALEQVSSEWHPIVHQALAYHERGEDVEIPRERIAAFVDAAGRFRSTRRCR